MSAGTVERKPKRFAAVVLRSSRQQVRAKK